MIQLRELKEKINNDIDYIAELHKRAFPTFFLSQLGIPFLRTLYSCYIEDSDSGVIVAEENNCIVGFIAFSFDYSRFYKELIKKHLIKFALCSFGAALRHPTFIKRLFGAFSKSDSVRKPEKYVELASICVDPQVEGNGVGSLLIDHLKSIVDFEAYDYINLETDAMNNDRVNSFYIKNGFVLERSFVTNEGRLMNEYRYKG